jgi:undecaprenyl-diphosphatase
VPLLFLAILAAVQGLTELLPISSSAHLILTWEVFGRLDHPVDLGVGQELVLDIASHVGTLFAICLYFWRDVLGMVAGSLRFAVGRRDPRAKLMGLVLLSAIPAGFVGILLEDVIAEHLRLVELIGWTQVVFAIVLLVADRVGMTIRKLQHLGVSDALLVGLAQALALIPGVSRAGITMTMGRFLGMERTEAARFSFLVAIPTIAGAGLLGAWELYKLGSAALGLDALITIGFSFLAGLFSLSFLMAWIRRQTFSVFVIYRVLLGCFLLWLVYSGTLATLHF